jgi:hypothetical protein
MKDYPHHMKKLTRRVIRSEHRLEREDESYAKNLPEVPSVPHQSKDQLRKQKKAKIKEERQAHIPSDLTPEQREKKMRKRVPIFDRPERKQTQGAKAPRKQRPL